MVNQREGLAYNIIDRIEEEIRKAHPKIDEMASKMEGNTLLYGEVYYDLENEIAGILEKIGVSNDNIVEGIGSQI